MEFPWTCTPTYPDEAVATDGDLISLKDFFFVFFVFFVCSLATEAKEGAEDDAAMGAAFWTFFGICWECDLILALTKVITTFNDCPVDETGSGACWELVKFNAFLDTLPIGAKAELNWIEECGHVPHLEQPIETANIITKFLLKQNNNNNKDISSDVNNNDEESLIREEDLVEKIMNMLLQKENK